MTRRKEEVTIDVILLGLVPKIVDKNPEILRDTKKYWAYAEAQAHDFLGSLPALYTAGLTEKKFKKEKSALYTCKDSPIDLKLGFKPGFNVYISPSAKKKDTFLQTIACQLYDLLFKPTVVLDGIKSVIQIALQHFFVYQQDMDAGTLKVAGFNGEERVIEDLSLLELYLPKGTVVEARTDCAGTGEARYRI